jgi:acetolactate synthase-1/2/3 large subunit
MTVMSATREVPRVDLNTDRDSVAAWIAHVPEAPRGRPHLRPARWAHPADLGLCRPAAASRSSMCATKAHCRAHGPCPCGADRRLGRLHGDGRTRRDELRHRHVANAFLARVPGPSDRRLHVPPAGQHGTVAGHPACRHSGKPVCRYSRTARVAEQVIREMDEAIARAIGRYGRTGSGLHRNPDRRAARERVRRRNWCWTSGWPPTPLRKIQPCAGAVQPWPKRLRHPGSARRPLVDHRARRTRGGRRRWSGSSMPVDALVPRHAGKPRARPVPGIGAVRRRSARRGDGDRPTS